MKHNCTLALVSDIAKWIQKSFQVDIPVDGRTILATPVAPLFIKIWLGPIPHYFSYQDKCVVSSLILSFKSCFPKEYDRKGRSLDDIHYRKAIDFFFFSFVFWPFYFETCPKSGKWVQFIHLNVAVYIVKMGYQKKFLCFVNHVLNTLFTNVVLLTVHTISLTMFTPLFIVQYYGIHGSILSYSAFAFESFLGQLVRLLQGTRKPFSR